ncbi:MAG: NAD(P)/FAD-dependent oxidoreductase [Myxococcota bacterium]
MTAQPHLVILGGGFAGLTLASSLRKANLRITLIDRRNHHLFQPLLYQVATAGLAPGDIAEPIRRILKGQTNVQVRLAEATGIDPDAKVVHLDTGESTYDSLVVATGARHHYFGNDEWEQHAPGLKTIGDALSIRRRLLTAFERAEWTSDPQERADLLTFVVVGAGPTGVELAGAIKEVALKTMRKEFRTILPERDARVILVEAGPKVLGHFPDPLPQKALKQLEHLGVEVRTNEAVTQLDNTSVTIGEERIDSCSVFWAAGVRASPLGADLGVERDRAGRVPVEADLSVAGHPNIYVLGDLATREQDGKPLPGVAPVAIQQAQHLAKDLKKGRRTPFRYRSYGSMATIGRSKAIVDIGPVQLSGFFAWFVWVFVHLMTLVGFRNRLVVFVKWAWSWWTFDRSSRLVWQGETEGKPTAPPPT